MAKNTKLNSGNMLIFMGVYDRYSDLPKNVNNLCYAFTLRDKFKKRRDEFNRLFLWRYAEGAWVFVDMYTSSVQSLLNE